jgi:acetoacetyl-CoA reductase
MSDEHPQQQFTLHEGNIGLADDCRRVVREVIDQHGRLDILVNNAGITIDRTVAKMSDEDWLRVLAVNLSGAFFIAQAALDHMIERGTGRIMIRGQIPVGRLGRPDEIARVVCFLAADQSAYITGQIWAVNGGLDM